MRVRVRERTGRWQLRQELQWDQLWGQGCPEAPASPGKPSGGLQELLGGNVLPRATAVGWQGLPG